MSKIVRFHQVGAAEVLQIEDVPVFEPGADEVQIRVRALGLNRAEVLLRQGRYLEKPALPSRIGYEASGVIEAIGASANLEGFAIGDKVSTVPCFSQSKYGVYGEWAVVPLRAIAKYPDNLSDIEAASIWMQYLTAYGALIELGGLTNGQTVLITAASSSVGFAAIQVARRQGAKVIATTRGETKKQTLLDAGAHHVIVTDSDDLIGEVMSATAGKGADLIFDAVAGPILLQLAKAAAYEASIFIYGALSLETTAFPLQVALKKGLSVRAYTMFQVTDDAARFARGKEYIYSGLKDGTLVPVIDKVFPFDQIVEAHRYMESNEQKGKIVVEV
ncbi:zinc-dependent alcohol dehydrogenase family protein [soil metagenome]